MAGKSRLPKLTLNDGQMSKLQQLSQSRTAPLREVQRARILCHYHAGETIAGIARAMEMTRKSVRKWIDKALAMGAEAALKDAYHRPRAPVITEEARAWVRPSGLLEAKGTGLRRRTLAAESAGAACAAR